MALLDEVGSCVLPLPETMVYLAHSASEKEEGKRAQIEIEAEGILVYNPFDKQPHIREAWDEKQNTDFSWKRGLNKDMNEVIVNSDLMGINKSQIVVMIYPDGCTIGIPCEMMYGWIHGKELHALLPERYEGHPWINHMCNVYPTSEYNWNCIDDIINAIKKTRPWLGDKPMRYCDWNGCSLSKQNDPGRCTIAQSGEDCHSLYPWNDRKYHPDNSDEEWEEYLFRESAYDRYVEQWNWWHKVDE